MVYKYLCKAVSPESEEKCIPRQILGLRPCEFRESTVESLNFISMPLALDHWNVDIDILHPASHFPKIGSFDI
ncbi:hypothetical protein KQX54_010195 [Cotesia glomerata]|uniref:Uncharacterized protein n=1 Tax=Cotesia glomerata TaxID=32391 RepID=A0AAV7J3S7_COTGL|nr:hypothetical protein KQX54_010195 [Cotesia glomerata]